jgi:hypothetical protein
MLLIRKVNTLGHDRQGNRLNSNFCQFPYGTGQINRNDCLIVPQRKGRFRLALAESTTKRLPCHDRRVALQAVLQRRGDRQQLPLWLAIENGHLIYLRDLWHRVRSSASVTRLRPVQKSESCSLAPAGLLVGPLGPQVVRITGSKPVLVGSAH